MLRYTPPHASRITLPQVTRGQVVYNTMVVWAELSFTADGEGFARNGYAPDAKGEWLPLSKRIAASQGKGAGPKNKKRRRNQKAVAKQDEGIEELLGRLSVESTEHEMMCTSVV